MKEITAHDLKAILGSVGAEASDNMLELLLSGVKGKDISDLIASGKEKMASVSPGCGGGVAGDAVEVKKVEEKKEEKVEEKKEEESDEELLFDIFD